MSVDWNSIARDNDHRPWPVPPSPWMMTMSWIDLLLAHWPVDPARIELHIPEELSVDTYEGQAWVTAVPFEMDNTLPRGLTWWPRPMRFAELNLRTYVTAAGAKPGVWFFSLDAASVLAVRGARAAFYLPYFDADMAIERRGDQVRFDSRRTHKGAPGARFSATYRPVGEPEVAPAGSLAHWLTARYCLYAADSAGTAYRADVAHRPWKLQATEAEIHDNTLGAPFELDMSDEPAAMHYARRLDVVGWFREPVGS